MTNTYMLGGDRNPAEILASVNKGIYAVNFGFQLRIIEGIYVYFRYNTKEAVMVVRF